MQFIQQEIRARLRKYYIEGKVPHAMLFAGPRGAGKLHIAVEFAKLLLCMDSKEGEPCGECKSCNMTKSLFHPDLLFVFPTVRKDAKDTKLSKDYLQTFVEHYNSHPFFSLDEWTSSAFADNKNPRIYNDEAVALLEKVNMKPSYGRRVVIFLCPEAGIMGEECANRLLKTIEEPDGRNTFIFISDNPGAIMETIFSRLQRIYFPPLLPEDIKRLVPNADDKFVKNCRGDMCRALELAENIEQVKENEELFKELMRCAYKREIDKLVVWTNDKVATMSRKEQVGLLEFFLEMLRECQIAKLSVTEASYVDSDMAQFIGNFNNYLKEDIIPKLIDVFSDAVVSIERNCQSKIVMFDVCMKILMLFQKK